MTEQTEFGLETQYDYNATDNRYPEFSPEPTDKRPLIFGIIFAAAIIILSIAAGVWLFFHPDIAVIIRDIFIIFLGISTFFILLFLIILIVMIGYLVLKVNDIAQLLNREVRPLLYNLQETTGTIRGTTTFLSENAAKPVITAAANIAAVKAIFSSLFRR